MIEIAVEHGADSRALLDGTPLEMDLLDSPDLRITAPDAARVMARVLEATDLPGIGLEFGLRTKPTAHGYLGYAAMSCANLREALRLVIRFAHLRQHDVTLSLDEEPGWIVLRAADRHGLGSFRLLIHEAMMVGFARMTAFLLGVERMDCQLWFDWPEPDYFATYRDRLPTTRFSMPAAELRVPAQYASRPLVMADPAAVRLAVEQCERELATWGSVDEKLVDRVRAQLTLGADGYADLETVASCLFLSPRTLKRRLAKLGTTFRVLLEEARRRDAMRLLENPDLDIQSIAFALGYQDPPSFTRAFKRSTGMTPSEARRVSRR